MASTIPHRHGHPIKARLVSMARAMSSRATAPEQGVSFAQLPTKTRLLIILLAVGWSIVSSATIVTRATWASPRSPGATIALTLVLLAVAGIIIQWGVVQRRASSHRIVYTLDNVVPVCALLLVPIPCAITVSVLPGFVKDYRDRCPLYVMLFNASVMGLDTGVLSLIWRHAGYTPDNLLSATPTTGAVIAILALMLAHHLLGSLLTYSGISWARGTSFVSRYLADMSGPQLRHDLSMNGIAIAALLAFLISPWFAPLVCGALYAMHVAMGNADVRDAAQYDHLTGLPNRATFEGRLDIEVAQARRHQTPLSVIFLDLDHFKDINDTHGHNAGDRALQAVARILDHMVRVGDMAARFAGDEFVIILPHTDDEGGHAFAERLSGALNGLTVHDHVPIVVACSMGVATYRVPETGDDLLHRADEANYTAKRTGRGRVAMARQAS